TGVALHQRPGFGIRGSGVESGYRRAIGVAPRIPEQVRRARLCTALPPRSTLSPYTTLFRSGPALLFTNVRDSGFGIRDSSQATDERLAFRLESRIFGTARRAELAFGDRPLRLIRRLVELAETLLPPTGANLGGARDSGRALLKVATRKQQT